MSRKTSSREWVDIECKGTLRERALLEDFLAERFFKPENCKFSKRGPEGAVDGLYCMSRKGQIGFMPVTIQYIRKEVRRYRARAKRERFLEGERMVGAFI